jgi:hypothetical protein
VDDFCNSLVFSGWVFWFSEVKWGGFDWGWHRPREVCVPISQRILVLPRKIDGFGGSGVELVE